MDIIIRESLLGRKHLYLIGRVEHIQHAINAIRTYFRPEAYDTIYGRPIWEPAAMKWNVPFININELGFHAVLSGAKTNAATVVVFWDGSTKQGVVTYLRELLDSIKPFYLMRPKNRDFEVEYIQDDKSSLSIFAMAANVEKLLY